MIKGNQTQTESKNTKYVGFAKVDVKSYNPSRAEINQLLEKDNSEDDKDVQYLSEDKEGNPRLRMSFWLHESTLDKYFIHSFNLTKKWRLNKAGDKVQVINSTFGTTWVPLKEDEQPDYDNLPVWFSNFTDKEGNIIAPKKVRPALVGEEELAIFMKAWLSVNPKDPETEVLMDTDRLFKEDFSEIRDVIGTKYTRSFVATVGVRTDINDSTKQYQQVYGKGFLPGSFIESFNKNFKGASDFLKNQWSKFETEIQGEYGFDAYYELVPLKEYDPTQDIATMEGTKVASTPVNSKF